MSSSKYQGTVSGLHGEYSLTGIPVGNQEIVFSSLGYRAQKLRLDFIEGEILELDIELLPGSIDLGAVTVEARQPFSAASSKSIRDFDLKIRPTKSAQDILSLVPGLFIAQHAGGGKAEQIFMRGFDADHGTDVGISVDGIPVNMVTHGHGQGYADLHFIIPEIIDGLTVYKGPYFSHSGNFATAGSVELTTTDHPVSNLVKMEGGMFNTAKATTVLKIPAPGTHQSAYIAGQYATTDGAVESPQQYNRVNLFGKFHTHVTPRSELGIAVGAFSSAWDASGQIPERAVKDGTISRWGSIDDLEGGITERYNFSVDYQFIEGNNHDFMIQAYVSKYDFKLFSNFTFFLNDSIMGDMIEQTDLRTIYGINTRYSMRKILGDVHTFTKFGCNYRGDQIDLSLWHSPDRIRNQPRTDNHVGEVNMSAWLEEDLVFNPYFKLQLGLRGDYFSFNTLDRLDDQDIPGNGLPHASGFARTGVLSPKINMVVSPTKKTDIYINFGRGFHSNDARDVIISQKISEIIYNMQKRGYSLQEINQYLLSENMDPAHASLTCLPAATGAELGLRFRINSSILASFSGWYLHMQEELVFIGDEGATERSGETRRVGMDAEIRAQITPWLWADLDLNLADGRYLNEPGGMNYIALAPRITSQGGLNFLHPSGIEGALRYRYMGDRPANENNSITAKGYFLGNIVTAYRFNGIRIFAQLENLTNINWNEAQFDTESRLNNETVSVSELHFTPGNPFNIQMGISYEF